MEKKASFYGKVQLIPGIVCDGYILNDNTSVLSERGTADLLDMDQKTLNAVRGNWPIKTLSPFYDKDLTVRGNCVEVVARNSPHCGRKIVVYTAQMIESLIRTYALAFANDGLRKNQIHIGKRAVTISVLLIRTALEVAIREACGLRVNIQQTAQKNYVDAVALIRELGFTCSVNGQIATKRDIAQFLKIPESTLNGFLRRYSDEIRPVRIEPETVKAMNPKARHLNGYRLEDVAQIAFGMDTETGIELKRRMFGELASCARIKTKEEIQWRKVLSEIFQGFGLHYNYPIGKYRVDFFVEKLMLCLECNGYEHRYYNPEEERKRESAILQKYGLVRFHHKICLETLFNGILQAKPGAIVKLYDMASTNKMTI